MNSARRTVKAVMVVAAVKWVKALVVKVVKAVNVDDQAANSKAPIGRRDPRSDSLSVGARALNSDYSRRPEQDRVSRCRSSATGL